MTLGLLHGAGDRLLRSGANALVALVVAGNIGIVASVQLGWLGTGA